MAIYAVGDIQGCYDPLRRLLDKVSFDPASDQLWCVGDLINRGPDSLSTLRYLKSLGDACQCVLGNHDLHLLSHACGGRRYDQDTLDDVLQASDADDLIDWVRHLPLLHHDADLNWCMVHAGLHPSWSLKKAKKRAKAVERLLQSDDWKHDCQPLFQHNTLMQEPECEKSGGDPCFSLSVLTRTRYCTADGIFDWGNKSGELSCSEYKAWFEHEKLRWRKKCRVVYGHWAARGLVCDQPHVLGLDSGCVWGKCLTLVRLDDPMLPLHSVSCESCELE